MPIDTRRATVVTALALSLLPACRSTAAAPPNRLARASAHAPRVEPIDAEHYFLDLALNPDARRLDGTCGLYLVAVEGGVRRVVLDLVGLEVETAREVGGPDLAFEQRDGELSIDLGRTLAAGERIELAIEYGGRPLKGLWFVGDADGAPTQVFTQGECEDSRFWFPCLDHPADRATSELRVSMPAHWTSVAAGRRLESEVRAGRKVEHWRIDAPHPCYLTTLVAGEFLVKEDVWDGVALWFLADPRYEEWMEASFEQTDEVLAFLSDVTGRRYPYSKYSQACVDGFPFGGMENITATTLTDATLADERGSRDATSHGLVAHEAAHQWFGDLLTCADWSHVWLNEGFATYMTALYFERSLGPDDFRVRMRDMQDQYAAGDVGSARRPTVHDVYRDPLDLFFGGHTYQGGAARLHLLRRELGDRDFFAGIRRYVADNAGRGVVTDDLRVALEEVSGRDLARFFEQWFRRPGYPEFEWSWSWNEKAGAVELDVAQVQEPGDGTPLVFDVPLDVEVRAGGGSELYELRADRRRQRFTLPAAEKPVWVRFDKHGWIPKLVTTTKSAREWLALACEDDDVNGRRDALRALGSIAAEARDERTRRILLDEIAGRLSADPVPAVRVAAARALAGAGSDVARRPLERAARGDAAAEVRVAALEALRGGAVDPELADLAQGCFDEGFSWGVMRAAAALRVDAAPADAFEWVVARLDVASPHDTLRAGLLEVLAGLAHAAVKDELLAVAGDPASGVAARSAAAAGLGRRGRDGEVRRCLLDLLDAREFRLRQAALRALGELDDERARRPLEALYARSVFPRERRALEQILAR